MTRIDTAPPEGPLDAGRLADLIERHGADVLAMVVTALRSSGAETGAAARAGAADRRAGGWRRIGTIEGFEHEWPEVHEHYGPMTVWERRDGAAVVRFAIGAPRERLTIFGRERGWVSVWEVVNGRPREQRANFIETDDFSTTGERIARIRGKGGNRKAAFEPGDRHLLPALYDGMRVEVQRDRCHGPYAPNRLGVVATDEDVEVMLDHALAHLRLGSGGSATGPARSV